jgi:hypothetical protein
MKNRAAPAGSGNSARVERASGAPQRECDRDDILYPISFDTAGAAAPMRVFFDAAEMQAKDIPPGELKRIIKDRYKTGYYKAPERAGISYMLSP